MPPAVWCSVSRDVVPGRRPHGPELADFVHGYRQRAGVTVDTGTHVATVGPGRWVAQLEEDATHQTPGHQAGTESGPGGGRASDGTTISLDQTGDGR